MASLDPQLFTTPTADPLLDEYARALESERAHSNEVEKMYEELKRIHENSIEEFRVIQDHNEKFLKDCEEKLRKSDDSIRELRHVTVEQTREITELRGQALTPQKEENLRLTVQAELERKFQDKIHTLTDENMALKSKNSALAHEAGMLRGNLEARENDFKRMKNDLVAKYERKIEDLKTEKEAVSVTFPEVDLQRFRQMQRDNDAFSTRAKALEKELEDVRNNSERTEEERRQEAKDLRRQITEKDSLVDGLKKEVEIHRSHAEALRKQQAELMEQLRDGDKGLLAAEREKEAITAEFENYKHRQAMDFGKEKVKLTSDFTAVQKEKGQLLAEIERLKQDVANLQQLLESQRGLLKEKEHEYQAKLAAVNQKHLVERTNIDHQRHLMESKLADAEKKLTEVEALFQSKMEALMDEQKNILLSRVSLEKEIESMQNKLAEYHKMELEFTRLQSQYSQLQQETKSLIKEIAKTETIMKALEAERSMLRNELEELHKYNLANEERTQQLTLKFADDKLELQESWMKKLRDVETEGFHLKQRIDHLTESLAHEQQVVAALQEKHRTFKKRASKIARELVNAIRQKDALLEEKRDSVTADEYRHSQEEVAQLKESVSRLKEILVPRDNTEPIAASVHRPTAFPIGRKSVDPKSPRRDVSTEAFLDDLKRLGFNGDVIDSPDWESYAAADRYQYDVNVMSPLTSARDKGTK